MNDLIIREATENDYETLLRFEQGVIGAERPFDPTLKQGHIQYYDIHELISAAHIHLLVAEISSQLVACGYARIETSKPYLSHTRHAYLGFMYTEPEYRGRGVNRKIIEALRKWSLSNHVPEMRLEVYFNNVAALKAYQKAGFTCHMIEMRRPTDSGTDMNSPLT